jgi:hypothetical protein
MTALIIFVAAVHLAGIFFLVVGRSRAPFGYEDKTGFHASPEPQPNQSNAGSP